MKVKRSFCVAAVSCILLLFSSCTNINSNTKKVIAAPILEKRQSGNSDKIEGTYTVINDPNEVEKCTLTITIKKGAKGYVYDFKSDSRSLTGKVSLEENEDKNGHYITFEGIEWSEYEGELDEDGEPKSKEPLELPVGLNGVLEQNQITFQNYGNSMNYYVQLADCGKKYIVLEKL